MKNYELKNKVLQNEQDIISTNEQLADKVTKEELNALGELRLDGTYDTLTDLQTSLPTGATGLYLVIADGYTYRWNGSAWVQAVQFQSDGIANNSIEKKKLAVNLQELLEDVYTDYTLTWTDGGYYFVGSSTPTILEGYAYANPISVSEGDKFKISGSAYSNERLYAIKDASDNLLVIFPSVSTTATYVDEEFTIPTGGKTLLINSRLSIGYTTLKKATQYKLAIENTLDDIEVDIDNINNNINSLSASQLSETKTSTFVSINDSIEFPIIYNVPIGSDTVKLMSTSKNILDINKVRTDIGSITRNGDEVICTANVTSVRNIFKNLYIPVGTYKIVFEQVSTLTPSGNLMFYKSDGTTVVTQYNVNTYPINTITFNDNVGAIGFYALSGVDVSNPFTFKLMIMSDVETDTTFESSDCEEIILTLTNGEYVPSDTIYSKNEITNIFNSDCSEMTVTVVKNINNVINDVGNYKNKKIWFFGDSITAFGKWVTPFVSIMRPSYYKNYAVSGAYWSYKDNLNDALHHVQTALTELANETVQAPDIIIMAYGTNDDSGRFSTDETIIESKFTTDGVYNNLTSDLTTLTDVTSAMRWCVEKLSETIPNAKIFISQPIQRVCSGTNGLIYSSQAIKWRSIEKLSERLSTHLVDTQNCGIYSRFEIGGAEGRYLVDGLHPNDDGGAKMADYIFCCIKDKLS